jgi:trimeric autotransporter adhesin
LAIEKKGGAPSHFSSALPVIIRRLMKRLTTSPIAFLICLIATALSGCHDANSPSSPIFVMGTATGLTGSVVLQISGGNSLSVTANGPFSFSMPIAVGSPYAVTVQTQPVGQTCTLSNGSGTAGSTNVTNVALTCIANTQTLGGTVSGLLGSLVLQLSGGDSLTITADGPFAFPTPVADTSTYAVTVRAQPADQTCTLADGSGIVGTANITNITVTCITNAFTSGGAISGLTGTVVLQNNGGDTQSISTDGAFTFPTPVDEGSPYLVTVKTQPAAQTCSVTNGSGTMGAARVTNVAVVCAANTYSAGGTVSGLAGTVVLQNNGSDPLVIGSNGAFTFIAPVAQGGTYSVTVQTQPAAQTCTVANGAGTMGGANVTNIAVTCSTNAYTAGGTVSGLNGTVTLQNDSTNSTPLSTNGSFTFSTPIAEGSTYNVTVQTQPAEQTCTVTNGSGTMGGASVTNVSVNCVTNSTTVTASLMGTIPVNGSSGSITITNTGMYTAYHVSAMLPGGWSGVTQDASNCAVLAPNGGTCTLTFTSTAPYVAQGNISINGDNITSPPTIALAFTIDGYLVFYVPTASTAIVVADSDASSPNSWSVTFSNIAGITDSSTAPPCNGATDGACDSGQIEAYYGTPYTNYAAGLCDEITSDNSGTVTIGTWYLPAICELGGSGQGASCSAGLANIDTNLVQLGFGGLNGLYWSSTEYSGNPTNIAWIQNFVAAGGSSQVVTSKTFALSTRCARAVTY